MSELEKIPRKKAEGEVYNWPPVGCFGSVSPFATQPQLFQIVQRSVAQFALSPFRSMAENLQSTFQSLFNNLLADPMYLFLAQEDMEKLTREMESAWLQEGNQPDPLFRITHVANFVTGRLVQVVVLDDIPVGTAYTGFIGDE